MNTQVRGDVELMVVISGGAKAKKKKFRFVVIDRSMTARVH